MEKSENMCPVVVDSSFKTKREQKHDIFSSKWKLLAGVAGCPRNKWLQLTGLQWNITSGGSKQENGGLTIEGPAGCKSSRHRELPDPAPTRDEDRVRHTPQPTGRLVAGVAPPRSRCRNPWPEPAERERNSRRHPLETPEKRRNKTSRPT